MPQFLYAKYMRLFILPALLLTAACDASTSPENLGAVPNVAFTTDATGYVAQRMQGSLERYTFTVISRYQNRGAVPVYLGRCDPTSPQPLFSVSLSNGAGESAYDQPRGCVGHDKQFMLLPGAIRIDTLTIGGPNEFPHGSDIGFGVTSGRFRLFFDVRLAPGDGAPKAPAETRLSNEFAVRMQQ